MGGVDVFHSGFQRESRTVSLYTGRLIFSYHDVERHRKFSKRLYLQGNSPDVLTHPTKDRLTAIDVVKPGVSRKYIIEGGQN